MNRLGLLAGVVLLGLAAGALAISFSRHATTDVERRWDASRTRMGMSAAVADRLAGEVRRGEAGPHHRTGELAADVGNLQDDVAHMVAIRRFYAIADAQADHAHRWRVRALPPAGLGVLVLLIVVTTRKPRPRQAG